jgi:hypothetical protein
MGFNCTNCQRWVSFSALGTNHRNHCPYCLHSIHLDSSSGDRKSSCKGVMKPLGLTFKCEGKDKYGKEKQGELMVIHQCSKCNKKSINRISGDDNPDAIISLFKKSLELDSSIIKEIEEEGIKVLSNQDMPEINLQLFGKKI